MHSLLALDIGGSAIKYGLWQEDTLSNTGSIMTPETWPEMKAAIQALVQQFQQEIVGVAIASPGAVDTDSGIIYGASAIDYIHRFPIRDELAESIGLPVSIQNDANCAALAEVWQGHGQQIKNSAYLIIGSGIGGAVVIDKQLQSGSHLFGGEFGFMIINNQTNQTLSEAGSPVTMSKNFSQEKNDGQLYSGAEVFALAKQGDALAAAYVDRLLQAIAIGAFNLAVTVDPEIILIGGAISKNAEVIAEVNQRLKQLILEKGAEGLAPVVKPCKFYNQANLLGAVYQFMLEKQTMEGK